MEHLVQLFRFPFYHSIRSTLLILLASIIGLTLYYQVRVYEAN